MTDLFAETKAEFNRSTAEILDRELSVTLRLTDDAERARNRGNVDCDAIAGAENSYASLLKQLFDPKTTSRLPIRTRIELVKKAKELRARIDVLLAPVSPAVPSRFEAARSQTAGI